MLLYKTLAKEGTAEMEVERSRFIVHAAPADSREEADAYIKSIREQYRDATHNVPAMVLGDHMQIQWGSDDGEPQGTSGAPIVHLLVEEGLTNCVVVVTRYFGGIKLGTGGLVRAYTGAAKLGIEAAGIREVEDRLRVKAAFAYGYLDRMEKYLTEKGYVIENRDFTEEVTMTILAKREEEEELLGFLREATKGTFRLLFSEYFEG